MVEKFWVSKSIAHYVKQLRQESSPGAVFTSVLLITTMIMGIASVQNPFTDRNMPYEQPFQPDAGDAGAVPIFVILSPIC